MQKDGLKFLSPDWVRKLDAFRDYYNGARVHRSLDGSTPAQKAGESACITAKLDHYGWRQHCRGLFLTPVAV